jgi:hypothetical protein
MDINDICKYIGYTVLALIVFYLAVKSITFQLKCVEGFVNKKPPVEGVVNKKPPVEGFVKQKPSENKTV